VHGNFISVYVECEAAAVHHTPQQSDNLRWAEFHFLGARETMGEMKSPFRVALDIYTCGTAATWSSIEMPADEEPVDRGVWGEIAVAARQ
jgi:hypothetical protein